MAADDLIPKEIGHNAKGLKMDRLDEQVNEKGGQHSAERLGGKTPASLGWIPYPPRFKEKT